MQITAIRECTVPLQGNVANALVNFSEHTVSLVAVCADVVHDGRPVVGLAFNSIVRFAQGGLLRERLIPRLLAARPSDLLDPTHAVFDPAKVLATMMRSEKPGGHGDRATAMGAVELAIWDLNANCARNPPGARLPATSAAPTDWRRFRSTPPVVITIRTTARSVCATSSRRTANRVSSRSR